MIFHIANFATFRPPDNGRSAAEVGNYSRRSDTKPAGDISPPLLAGGFKVPFIPIMYGMSIYATSLIIRMFQNPKI